MYKFTVFCYAMLLSCVYLHKVCEAKVIAVGRNNTENFENMTDDSPLEGLEEEFVYQNTTNETLDWRKQWKEEWTNWFNISNPNPPPSSSYFVHLSLKQKFLTVLHLEYKGEKMRCLDKNKVDCPVWANFGYCDHERPRYTTWMTENCPESCGQCPSDDEEEINENQCKNLKQTCDRLITFCTGPFKSHMKQFCPLTCGLCETDESYSVGDEGSGFDPPKQTSVGISHQWNGAQVKTAQHVLKAEDQICFPTKCGEVPVFKYQPSVYTHRLKRSVDQENRRRRRRRFTSTDSGFSQVHLKIVGGSWAKKGEFPWHGLIIQKVDRYVRFCGITVICRRWLVTAAHCLASTEYGFPETRDMMNTFTIYVGRHQGMFGYMESTSQIFKKSQLKRFIIHPKFKITPSFSYDIALVELSESIRFGTYVQPVCIPTVNIIMKKDYLWSYGWGVTLGYGPTAQYLKKVDLPFVEKEECKKYVWGLPKEGIMCAGGEARKDTCTGDSGGSLVKQTDDERFYIFGVTSYGNKHCNSRYPYSPGIYTDVAFYYEWIRNETKSCCGDDYENAAILKG